ncbi:MAG: hypothetical protein ACKOQ4_03530 [Mycobacterium sp.]
MQSSLRSRSAIALLAASLLTTLVLGVVVVVFHRVFDLGGRASQPAPEALDDEQSRSQVLEPARQFVRAGKLRSATGGYLLMSCGTEEQPPYQGTVYMNFDVPTVTETPAYFREIARAMKDLGWREGLPPGRHPGGHTLAREGLIAVYHRDADQPGRGVLEISGECRNMTDHSADSTGFVDVTRELNR